MYKADDRNLHHLLQTGRGFYLLAGVLLVLIAWGLYAFGYEFTVGDTGANTPMYWGLPIANYVFFVGLSAGGIIVASLVYVFNMEHFRPVARIAEILAIISILMAMMIIVFDIGRPDRFWHLYRYGRLQSPLVINVYTMTSYLIICLAYLYFGSRADIVACMKRFPQRRPLYWLLTLGQTNDSDKAIKRDRKILKGIALLALPTAIALHSITGFIFGVIKAQPGWHTAILPPLFVVSALVSGLGLVIVVSVLGKKFFKLSIEDQIIYDLSRYLVFLMPVLAYLLTAEWFTVWFAGEETRSQILSSMFKGTYAPIFWADVTLGLAIPFTLLVLPRTKNIPGITIAATLAFVGVLAERIDIVLPSLTFRQVLYYSVGTYSPSWTEYSISLGTYAIGILIFLIIAKLIPLVENEHKTEEVSEVQEKTIPTAF
ncbi:MAG: polysulfide reductase NrfD [Chloroflexi bacterium]|nr:polysulfide reductase NrfD [Chloroflexota bacterium]